MTILKEEFVTNYSVKAGLVKSSIAGVINGNDYSSSVRIICINQYEKYNEKTAFDDESSIMVSFKIPCPSNEIAGEVAKAIKNTLRNSNTPLNFSGSLPTKPEKGDGYVVNVSTPYDTFLASNKPISEVEFNAKVDEASKKANK